MKKLSLILTLLFAMVFLPSHTPIKNTVSKENKRSVLISMANHSNDTANVNVNLHASLSPSIEGTQSEKNLMDAITGLTLTVSKEGLLLGEVTKIYQDWSKKQEESLDNYLLLKHKWPDIDKAVYKHYQFRLWSNIISAGLLITAFLWYWRLGLRRRVPWDSLLLCGGILVIGFPLLFYVVPYGYDLIFNPDYHEFLALKIISP